MKAKAWRLYGARDARLEDIELEAAGDEGIVVELVTNTICLSDYNGVTLGEFAPHSTAALDYEEAVSAYLASIGD